MKVRAVQHMGKITLLRGGKNKEKLDGKIKQQFGGKIRKVKKNVMNISMTLMMVMFTKADDGTERPW